MRRAHAGQRLHHGVSWKSHSFVQVPFAESDVVEANIVIFEVDDAPASCSVSRAARSFRPWMSAASGR